MERDFGLLQRAAICACELCIQYPKYLFKRLATGETHHFRRKVVYDVKIGKKTFKGMTDEELRKLYGHTYNYYRISSKSVAHVEWEIVKGPK